MFTGIITAVGTLRAIDAVDGGRELLIAVPWTDIEPGESIAVDGACLTVTGLEPGAFRVHVITTSMERTRIGEYQVGTRVNLERAVRAGDRLGATSCRDTSTESGQSRRSGSRPTPGCSIFAHRNTWPPP
jgi:riboflavin synthase